MKQKGFTLVELAIVLMIIGLLIGGILKGQELITNARITNTIRQYKAYDAAVITFQDSYNALPGDITNPDTRLPNCSAAPCNIVGNGNGIIGVAATPAGDENNTFWLHLNAANLISGIDSTRTWTSGNYYTASYPRASLGFNFVLLNRANAPNGTYALDGLIGNFYLSTTVSNAGSLSYTTPVVIMGRMDQKIDDGHPFRGSIKLYGNEVPYGSTSYTVTDPSVTGSFHLQAGF